MTQPAAPRLPKAQFGEAGWLFLDNDANRSVGQYLGQVRLSPQAAVAWKVYFDGVLALRDEVGFKFVQLFAPSKEIIYERYYPHRHAASPRRPVHAVIELAPPGFPICYPWRELIPPDGGLDTYDKGDTHWNPWGAALGTSLALGSIGIEIRDVARYNFAWATRSGDLDTKFPGYPVGQRLHRADPPIPNRTVFLSGLTNRGSLVATETPGAPDRTVFVFGDSFSDTMLGVLRENFRRVIIAHVHTLDAALVRAEQPDVVIAQMVDRFVIKPPSCPDTFRIEDVFREKAAQLPADEVARLRKMHEAALGGRDRHFAGLCLDTLPFTG